MRKLAWAALLLAAAGTGVAQRRMVAPVPSASKPAAPPAAAPAAEKTAAAKPVPSVKDLKYPPLRPIQIPKVETFTLPNGMRLYLLEDHELPVVNGSARVRTGNLFDPADKVGLAGITGTVMRTGGTKDKTGNELDEQLENIAASVETGIGETSGSVSFSALKENTDDVLAIFKSVLTQPEFRQDKVDLAKTQARGAISRRNDDAHGVASREFSDLIYGRDTPYGWRTEYATVEKISRADLQAFYQRYFFPKNIMLAVWGDFNAAEMKVRLERLLADWKVEQPPVPEFPKVAASPKPGTYLAVKEDVAQTFFVMGHVGGELRDKDYPALEVMADILGGGFRSRLVQRVRSRMGAAYSISASWGANYGHPGLFTVSGSTKSISTVETIRAVQEEITRIRTTEVTPEELETARQSALNSLVFAFDTRAKTLGRILTYEYWGYPKDFIERYQKALAAVTRADVLRVAKERLKPEDVAVTAVGKPSDFGVGLESLGSPVTPIDLSIAQPRAVARVDETTLAAGLRLLRLVQNAAGGSEKIAAVKDLVETVDYQIDPAAGGMKVKQTNRWVAPTHFRQDSQMPIGRISAYSDGKIGWISTPQGSGPLGGAQLRQVQGDLFRLYFRLLSADRLNYRINLVSDRVIEFSNEEGDIARLTVHSATALPERLTYESVHVAGPPVVVEDMYSDFREVGGIKLPFKVSITQGGRKFADLTVEDYKLNTGIEVAQLAERPR